MSLVGGRGGVFSVVAGGALIGTLLNAFTIMNVNSEVQNIIRGVVLLAAIILGTGHTHETRRQLGKATRKLKAIWARLVRARTTIITREDVTWCMNCTLTGLIRAFSVTPVGGPVVALAQEEAGTKTAHELRADYDKNVKVEATIAFLRIATGCRPDGRVGHRDQDGGGMARYEFCDPRSQQNPAATEQALTALVDEKPDVIVVQTRASRCCKKS